MTYTDRVNILAEKMALVKYPTRIENDRVWNSVIADFIPLAEIALEEMAEIAKDGYDKGWIDSQKDEIRYNTGIQNYITKTGLVPDKK